MLPQGSRKRKTVYFAVLILGLILVIGTGGYMLLEGVVFLDALYMTMITVSTVGFKEVMPLSSQGKLFTILLIILSLGTFAYALSMITSLLFEGEARNLLSGYRKNNRLKKMKNHVIICGFGRNGRQAVRELRAHQHDFIVVDDNADALNSAAPSPEYFIRGDATEDHVLVEAGIMNARALITTLPNDADNLYVALTARSLNPDVRIISRCSSINAEKKLRVAGVDHLVLPEHVGGAHMAMLVAREDLVEFLDHLSVHGNAPTNLEEIVCDGLSAAVINKTIHDLKIRSRTGVNIVGCKTSEDGITINPPAETRLTSDMKLFILATPSQYEQVLQILKGGV